MPLGRRGVCLSGARLRAQGGADGPSSRDTACGVSGSFRTRAHTPARASGGSQNSRREKPLAAPAHRRPRTRACTEGPASKKRVPQATPSVSRATRAPLSCRARNLGRFPATPAMAAAGPSVFLLMVNGQVESAQVSGRGPCRAHPPGFPRPSRHLPGCCVAPKRLVISWLGGGGEPALEKLGARLLEILNPGVRVWKHRETGLVPTSPSARLWPGLGSCALR